MRTRSLYETRTKDGATTDTAYECDAAGNRTKKMVTTAAGTEITTYSYGSADRLTQESVSLPAGGTRLTTYAWDQNGNLQSKTEPGKVSLYRFDPQNRLIDIRTGATQAEASAAAPSVSYSYDAAGNRVKKGGTNPASYLIDPSHAYAQVALETRAGQSTSYVRGLQLIRQTKVGASAADDILPLHGHLGTSLGAVDANGDVAEQTEGDAFGSLEQTAGLKQNHLYAGEYWDQDGQLLYLRARWYDPKIGFISPDPVEGKQRDPRSLNRYAYAHSDPVHNADPSGAMSLGELGSGLNVQSVLTNVAKDQAFGFMRDRIFGEDETLDSPPSLFDTLVMQLIKAMAGSVAAATTNSVAVAVSGKTQGHHVIPEYMCGAHKQELVDLPKPAHDKLHKELYAFDTTVKLASKVYELLFRKRNPNLGEVKSPIARTAKNPQGRAAIAIGLGIFYENYGYGGAPWVELGRGQKTKLPLGAVLLKEAVGFAGSSHNYPTCTKK